MSVSSSTRLNDVNLEAVAGLAAAIQERAFEIVPYIPTGQWKTRTAYRKNLKDMVHGPVIFQWGVEKA